MSKLEKIGICINWTEGVVYDDFNLPGYGGAEECKRRSWKCLMKIGL